MKHEEDSSRPGRRNEACPCPDCRLPPQGPPAWLRDKAVPIWCGTYYAELATEIGQDAAEEHASAFAYGFEKGVTTAMLRPEWAQGFYLKLREYYLLTHTPADLAVWEAEAEETGRCQCNKMSQNVTPCGGSHPLWGFPWPFCGGLPVPHWWGGDVDWHMRAGAPAAAVAPLRG